jgi:hypothetical protein
MAERRILVQVVTPGRREVILDKTIGTVAPPVADAGGVGGGGLSSSTAGLLTAQDLFTSQTLFTR